MAKRNSKPAVGHKPLANSDRYCNVHQVGGIATAVLDHPGPGASASGQGTRVALVNTGSPLRFTVNLDRGGDITDAFYGQHGLAFLTPNGFKPPSHAYHHESDWLDSWHGGLLTTCGPRYIGSPRDENGERNNLHGHHHNTPAAVEMLLNPEPRDGRSQMLLSLVNADTRMFGPNIEVRRQIQCTLGRPEIHIYDHVTNRHNTTTPHSWMYHCNLGFPLLDRGARLVYRGKMNTFWSSADPADRPSRPDSESLDNLKNVPSPQARDNGAGGRIVLIDPMTGGDGLCHVGLVNAKLGLAVEFEYPLACFPRLTNWQHFGQAGSYVTGIEPFAGTLFGRAADKHPGASLALEPGESRRYRFTIRVHEGDAARRFLKHDGPVTW